MNFKKREKLTDFKPLLLTWSRPLKHKKIFCYLPLLIIEILWPELFDSNDLKLYYSLSIVHLTGINFLKFDSNLNKFESVW